MEQAINPALYRGNPSYLAKLVIEFTNHCNLRCRYCHQNRPIFKPNDPVSEENFDNILEFVRQNSVDTIDLVGGGDILMYPAWAEKCKKLLDAGIKLSTTINLGRLLDADETEVLAGFSEITASIDTMNRKILASVRKSVDIRTILYNMMRIKAAAYRSNHKIHWKISAVYSAEIAFGLPELASFAAAFGAETFQIQDIMIFNDITDNVTPVWELAGREAQKAVSATKEALGIAARAGMDVLTPPDFLSRMDALTEIRRAA